jgi:hypothetical protein
LTPEEQLATLMEAVVGDLAPPLGEILAGAERRGRRLKRQRRIVLAIGAAGVAILSAVGVDAGLHLTGSTALGVASQATATPGTPHPTGEASAVLPIDYSAEILILHTLLPTSWTFSEARDAQDANLWITMDDGKGPFSVYIDVASASDSRMDPVNCTLQGLPTLAASALTESGAQHEGCALQVFPNGDKAMEEAVGMVAAGGYYQYRIIVGRADGVAVEIEASDGLAQAGKVTRTAPPLTLAQWTQIARDRLWQLEIPEAAATPVTAMRCCQ